MEMPLNRIVIKRKVQPKSGFTLLEVLLATVITAFIALVSVSVMAVVVSGREKIEHHTEEVSELRYITNLIKKDLNNIIRLPKQQSVRFVGTSGDGGTGMTSLRFYCINRQKARPNAPESDFYEVEYAWMQEDETPLLYRRLWPVPESNEDDPRGVLMKLSDKVKLLAFRYLDNEDEWQLEWSPERKALPKMVEVNIAVEKPNTNELIRNSFFVSFPRWPEEQKFAQR